MEETYKVSIPRPAGEETRQKQSNVNSPSSLSRTRKYGAVVFAFFMLVSILAIACVTTSLSQNDSVVRGGAFSSFDRHLLRKGNDANDFSNFHAYVSSNANDSCTVECCNSILEKTNTKNRRTEESKEDEENSWVKKVPFPAQMILIVVLISFSALFSGLTLGLMGLDKTGLEIVMEGDDANASAAARAIYPVRENGNLLLCTLLLGNVAVNALLSILMADISGGLIGFLVSTISIVIFGEIVPQAACSRYALQIGRRAVPLVKFIMLLFWPISAPIAFCLDKVLGHELGTTYSKAEMSKLLEIHVKEGRFNQETGTAMTGALKYQDITVKEVMTPIQNTFMLDADEKLSFETITKVFKTGFSRIPVYEVSVNNIIGLLFVKDLIFLDPEDETPVKNFVEIFGRGAHVVWPDDKLGDVLRELKGGHSHMALVRDVNSDDETQDPFYEIKGIITLEDIIEVILGDEIVDETDAWVDGSHTAKVDRSSDFDWAKLRLLDSKIVDETLSQEEVRAIAAHLRMNHKNAVELLSEKQLNRLVSQTPVTVLPASELDIGDVLPDILLYEKGKQCDFCTLVLSGKITVLAGSDNFRSDISSWCVLAANALTNNSYTPDFNAYVSGECRCLIFTRHKFSLAVDASAVEKMNTGRLSLLDNNEWGKTTEMKDEIKSKESNFDAKTHFTTSTSLHDVHSTDDLNSIPTKGNDVMYGNLTYHGEDSGLLQNRKAKQEHRSKLLHAFYKDTLKNTEQQTETQEKSDDS